MYENGITVVYELRRDHLGSTGDFGPHGLLRLPGWAAGDPQMAVALHFFGHRDAVDDVRVTDWSPIDDDEPSVEDTLREHPLFPGIIDEESYEAPERPTIAASFGSTTRAW